MSERTGKAAPTTETVATAPAAAVQVSGVRRPLVQRQCACGGTPGVSGECAECRRKRQRLQRSLQSPSSAAPASASGAPLSVHQALQSPALPLDAATRGFMESRLGHDLSRVRVHTDGRAATSARAVSARAYTVGRNVVFGAGQYAPDTYAGLGLLAHELTHTLQQGDARPAVQRQLEIGASNDPAERQADRIARQVIAGGAMSTPATVSREIGGSLLRRVPTTPQRRGDPESVATLELPPRGDDEVRIRVFRYLCHCRSESVTRTDVLTRTSPNPGITLFYCRGRTTLGITGDVIPDGFISGTVRAGVLFNYAPVQGSTGVRVQVEGEARNTGDEPQVGGRAQVTVQTPQGSPNVGASGEIRRGTETGQLDTRVGAEVELRPGLTLGVEATNPQDERRGGNVFLSGRFGATPVSRERCQECRCPVVYNCFRDIPSRRVEEETQFEVQDETSLRYYFSLNTNRDARDPGLRAESGRSLDRLAQLVAGGATIVSITGHASPEADQEALNEELSGTRGQRLHELIAARLPDAELPEPTAGGELLGSRATILPGSGLRDAIIDAGFDGPEEVSAFLIGYEIDNDELANQFLDLLGRVTESADRLRLFGVDASSPVAARLLTAIEQFIAGGGRGRRPWDSIFEFLRVATVKVSQSRTETVTTTRDTESVFDEIGDALCNRYARQAEDQGLFGPAQQPPSEADCPSGEPTNARGVGDDCDYTG